RTRIAKHICVSSANLTRGEKPAHKVPGLRIHKGLKVGCPFLVKEGPIQPVSGVNRASVPVTPLTPRVMVQKHRAPVLAAATDPNRGIALRFEPTAKEKFQVDDCGNAWRIVGRDES